MKSDQRLLFKSHNSRCGGSFTNIYLSIYHYSEIIVDDVWVWCVSETIRSNTHDEMVETSLQARGVFVASSNLVRCKFVASWIQICVVDFQIHHAKYGDVFAWLQTYN